ncbi:MAG TPA: ATP synthase subunit I [Methylophilus sp.]|nr:ATP synthase subunit I [Rugosibacter sp.]HQN64864.1 ATP synthase subunit I [Methylophilus sp.]HQQ32335.1 ATP synthase subunit I [Methylophilus sp.]
MFDSGVVSKMLRWQLTATTFVAIIAFVLVGRYAAVSVMLGGLSAMLGAFCGALISQRSRNKTNASEILGSMLKGEGVKIVVIVASLFCVFKFYQQLVPFALIAGLAVGAIFSGAAIAKTKD